MHGFETREVLADALAAEVAERLRAAFRTTGRASLAVPGGITPGAFLMKLSNAELDWTKVAATLTDERWVPPTHDRSNHRLLNETLFAGRAKAARFVPLYRDTAEPEAALALIEEALRTDILPLDICVLGMGTDGHIASLFPGADNLDAALSDHAPPVLAMRAPGAPEPRVTLTAPVLRAAKHIYLLITGEEKAAALKVALRDGPVAAAPARIVLRGPSPVDVFFAP